MARKKGKKLTDKRQAKTPKRSQPKETRAQLRTVSANRLKQILAAHKKWLETKGKQGNQAHLPGANLQRAHLEEANLQEAFLIKTNLQRAHLEEANLQEAFLIKTNLQKAHLRGTNLQRADLRSANLSFAQLQGANLSFAQLQGADLIFAQLQGAKLSRANLQGAYLFEVKAVTASQIKRATNWRLAFYSEALLKQLGFPADHNETVLKKFKKIEKEKEKAATNND